MRYCPRCGAKNTSGDPVCRRCGQKLYGLLSGQERVTCQACGTATPPDAAFCLGCGRPAGAQVSRPPVAAPPVEVAARPSAPRPRVELSGPVASDDGLESPRAKGCLIAVLAVALVATTGASLLFRPAQHTLVLERPVATEVAVDDEAASGLGPAGDGLVGEGVIAASARPTPPARRTARPAAAPAQATPAPAEGRARARSDGDGEAKTARPEPSVVPAATVPRSSSASEADRLRSEPNDAAATVAAGPDAGSAPGTPRAGAVGVAPTAAATPAAAGSEARPGLVGPALVDPVRVAGRVATPIELPTESGSMILLLSQVDADATPLPGRRRLTLLAAIDNVGTAPLAYDRAAFRLTDGDGATYAPLPLEPGAIGDGVLPPGGRVTLRVGFEIPADRADLTLRYQSALVVLSG